MTRLERATKTDDLGRYFSGLGLELYTDYELTERVLLRAALSYVGPESAHPGDYEILTLTPGFNYKFSEALSLVVLARLDGSTLSDGSERNADTFSASAFFNF